MNVEMKYSLSCSRIYAVENPDQYAMCIFWLHARQKKDVYIFYFILMIEI